MGAGGKWEKGDVGSGHLGIPTAVNEAATIRNLNKNQTLHIHTSHTTNPRMHEQQQQQQQHTNTQHMGLFLTLVVFLLAFAGNDWPLEYCPWPIGIVCKGLVDGEI